MPFATALSTIAETSQALEEVCAKASSQLPTRPDLALLFFSAQHASEADALVRVVAEKFAPRCFLGCSGEAIVNNDQEIEQSPALSLWLAQWGRRMETTGFHLEMAETPEGPSLLGWPDAVAEVDPAQSVILLLGDPFSFPVDAFLQQVNANHPGLRVVGGMASGLRGAGHKRLLLDGRALDHGAVGVLLQGQAAIRGIVSQGCRPIGRHMVITKAQENIIVELGGKPPLVLLQRMWEDLSPADRELFQRGLHVGRVINEYQGEFQRGDFLVRNVIAADKSSGALAITDRVRVGQTIQFHVRDAATADEDLHALLQLDLAAHAPKPGGGLLFTCNGLGTGLFGQPHHDARAIQAEIAGLPLAGFFAQGELGPVGGQNFIHGFTASVVLFEE